MGCGVACLDSLHSFDRCDWLHVHANHLCMQHLPTTTEASVELVSPPLFTFTRNILC